MTMVMSLRWKETLHKHAQAKLNLFKNKMNLLYLISSPRLFFHHGITSLCIASQISILKKVIAFKNEMYIFLIECKSHGLNVDRY